MSEITSCLAGPAPVVPTPEVESRVASGLERKEVPAAPRGSLCILSCSHHTGPAPNKSEQHWAAGGAGTPFPAPRAPWTAWGHVGPGAAPVGDLGESLSWRGVCTGQGPDPDPPANQQLFSLDPQAWS